MKRELEYRDFRGRLEETSPSRPLFAQVELTFRCNLHCLHCYVGSLKQERRGEEMDLAFLKGVMDQLARAGFLWLCFTGGEPLMREDFGEIYAYARKKGFIIIILTNGTLLSPDVIRLFKKHKPFYLEIPLNALDPGLYEKISGVEGSFNRLQEGIGLLRENHIPFKLKTKAMALNLGELKKIRGFADELGVPYGVSPTIHTRLDRDETPLRLRVTPQQMARFFKEEDAEAGCASPVPEEEEGSEQKRLFRCGAATVSVCIDPFGHLIACPELRRPRFDLRTATLEKGLGGLLDEIPCRNFETDSGCAKCKIRDVCELCPGIAGLDEEGWEGPVEYFCQVARIRDEQRKEASAENS